MPLQTLVEQGSTFSRNHGDSVRETRLGTAEFEAPEHIFLMYLRFDRDSCLHVSHYYDRLDGRAVDRAEEDLMKQARPSHQGPKDKLEGHNFEKLEFGERCYFTIILDEERWEFYDDPAVPGNPPLVFLERKPGDPTGTLYEPNRNFYDAETVRVMGRPALRCINYGRKTAAGLPSKFCFEINLRAPFSMPGSERFITLVIDPTGENKGPQGQ